MRSLDENKTESGGDIWRLFVKREGSQIFIIGVKQTYYSDTFGRTKKIRILETWSKKLPLPGSTFSKKSGEDPLAFFCARNTL